MRLAKIGVALVAWVLSSQAQAAGARAVLCLDEDFKLGRGKDLIVHSGTVFRNHGPISGDITAQWKSLDPQKSKNASFVTLEDATLTTAKRCVETRVEMFVDGILNTETSAKAADKDYWSIDDSIAYVPGRKPSVELGKLVDDMAVLGQLREDVSEVRTQSRPVSRDAASCLADAKSLAAQIGGGVGRQTSSVVFIGHPAVQEMSIDCNFQKPSIFIAWNNRAKPSAATLQVIAKSGRVLTGASEDTVKTLVSTCVAEAMKPESNELANHEIDGVRAECQSFSRDGGAGSVTILRRFGSYPPLAAASPASLRALDRETERLRAQAEQAGESGRAFAAWWMDPAVPTTVKSALMLVARMQALGERCPSWKPSAEKLASVMSGANIAPRDIQHGGRYRDTYAMLFMAMSEGTKKESVQSACEAANKYGR